MSKPSPKVKLFSLTDVDTPTLRNHKMLNQPLVIWRYLLNPGDMLEVEDSPQIRAHASEYVRKGALAVNELPSSYTVAKVKSRRV